MPITRRHPYLVLVAAGLAGCSGAPPERESPPEPVGTARAAIAATVFRTLSTTLENGEKVDLGPFEDRTCFLQGLSGEIVGSSGSSEPAGVQVVGYLTPTGRHWFLRVRAGHGGGVKASAACIPTVNRRQFLSWDGNTAVGDAGVENEVFTESGTPLTQCFLTGVRATTGFTVSLANVDLRRQTGSDRWRLGGFMMPESDGSAGGTAGAVCVDLLAVVHDYSFTGPYTPEGGRDTLWQEVSNTTCSVTRLRGKFANAPGGLGDGAYLYNSVGTWRVFASMSKQIAGNCYEDYF